VKKYVLDTNLYVQAFRSEEGARQLGEYYAAFTPGTYLSSIVLHELLVGANTEAKHRTIMEILGLPLGRAGRVLTPTHAAWVKSAEALARMARREKRDLRSVPKSLVNDYLLAASCREAGATLITDNIADFKVARRYLRFEYMAPWPGV
jgi:predicted nucleic acid-binding protein